MMKIFLALLFGVAWAQLPPGYPGPPPPSYMVNNEGNTFGLAPDKANFTGPVTSHPNSSVHVSDPEELSRRGLPRRNINLHSHSHSHGHMYGHGHTHAYLHHRSHGHAYSEQHSTERNVAARGTSGYWLEWLGSQGKSPYAPDGWTVFRNVRDYGAKGDGVSDDTKAINDAITDQDPCGKDCGQTSVKFTVIFFPAGTYLISSPIIQYYYSQFVGDPNNRPILKGMKTFKGIAIIDTDPYIPGANGNEWYVNQNQFYRQIRNFVIDMKDMPNANYQGDQQYNPTGIHWQVAQATSLQNIEFNMAVSGEESTTAVGIFMENGSGGFVSDLVFNHGNIGFRAGSQQFTARNLQFNYCLTGVSMIWNWGFVWKDITMSNVYQAFDCTSAGGIDGQGTGSLTIIDSKFYNVPYAIPISSGAAPPSIYLDNLVVDGPNSRQVVFYSGHADSILEVTPGAATTINGWAMGNRLQDHDSGVSNTHGYVDPVPQRPSSLNNADGTLFARSKPQYGDVSASDIVDVLGNSISNDGTGDQSGAINALLRNARGKVIFFPAGIYRVEHTITIPEGSKIIGSAWSQIMAAGSYFGDASNPQVVVRVGEEGDVGSVEISDMLFTVKGATAGAILMEWNIHEGSQGSAAMWDAHFRVGGAKGSDLQLKQCPAGSSVNSECIAATMLFHMTGSSSGYFENVWMWTADHDLDSPASMSAAESQINVVSARGALIESQGPTWFYGSGVEHNLLYQYELYGAKNIFLGHMQTETPYYQPTPATNDDTVPRLFETDPSFYDCETSDKSCNMAYALRIIESTDVYIYGAGLYSFFSSYSEDCLDSESCQKTLLETNFAQAWVMNLFTKGAIEAASPRGDVPLIAQKDTQAGFTTELSIWSALGVSGESIGDYSSFSSTTNEQYFPWNCPDAKKYADLDAIAADNSIPVTCHNYYILAVMSRNLTASLEAYNSLMADGYEEKFKYYVKAVEATAPINWNKFYHNEYDDLVTCTWLHPESKSSNLYVKSTGGCPPNRKPSYAQDGNTPVSLTTNINDKDAFVKVTENQYGIQGDWINFDAKRAQQQWCNFHPPHGVIDNRPCPVGDTAVWHQPELWSNISVQDPAKSISKALDNYMGISRWLQEIVIDIGVGLYAGQDADVVDAMDVMVYTVDAAVTSMQAIYEVGDKVEEKIKEEEHKNLILLFISAFLLLLPGLGEELDLIIDASVFARMGTMIGDVGEGATALYTVYEDPQSAPLAIGGLLIGGFLAREESALANAAKIRRAMGTEKIGLLGAKTEGNLNKLKPLRARCDM